MANESGERQHMWTKAAPNIGAAGDIEVSHHQHETAHNLPVLPHHNSQEMPDKNT